LAFEQRTLFRNPGTGLGASGYGFFSDVKRQYRAYSEQTDYLATDSMETTAFVSQFIKFIRKWAGGFSRNAEEDAKALSNPFADG